MRRITHFLRMIFPKESNDGGQIVLFLEILYKLYLSVPSLLIWYPYFLWLRINDKLFTKK